MHLSSVLPALAFSALTVARLHIVRVAPGGDMVFSPNTIQAVSGDQIQFNFPAGGEYAVARGDWDDPCQPADNNNDDDGDDDDDDNDDVDLDDWYSGFVDEGRWTITIDDDDSYPFYSTGPGQCQAGMIGVINSSTDNDDDDDDDTLEAYRSAASTASGSGFPATVQGGIFRAAGSAQTSSASASTNAPASPTATGASATTTSTSIPSTGGAGQLLIHSIAGTTPFGMMAYLLL